MCCCYTCYTYVTRRVVVVRLQHNNNNKYHFCRVRADTMPPTHISLSRARDTGKESTLAPREPFRHPCVCVSLRGTAGVSVVRTAETEEKRKEKINERQRAHVIIILLDVCCMLCCIYLRNQRYPVFSFMFCSAYSPPRLSVYSTCIL